MANVQSFSNENIGQSEPRAVQIARTILDGFDRHFSIFLDITRGAKERFERGDWQGVQETSRERIYYYDKRVKETGAELKSRYDIEELDEPLWQEVKFLYVQLLFRHKQPELAETFYNSVFCHFFHRSYYNNNNIFVRSSVSTEFLDSEEKNLVYRCYYPAKEGLRSVCKKILLDFDFALPYEDISRDVRNIVRLLNSELPGKPHFAEIDLHIKVVTSIFFRNKGAYIIGKALNGYLNIPFIIPLVRTEHGCIRVDSLLLAERDISAVFSFSQAYFMVTTTVPSAMVSFLGDILPSKSKADLYSAIGLHKQGKTDFYREFLHYLRHSQDKLVTAPGIEGMVMMVFTLPSFSYVFKVIRDRFAPPKEMNRETVIEKYRLVKQHDRVGRMADSLEYSHVAFPIDRFDQALLQELFDNCRTSIEVEGDQLVIRHLYIERRMVPLNIYFGKAGEEELDKVVREYGDAIKQMAMVNIFPGDMLYKNFGVTRNGKVVFYDYDEVCYMTDCRFRRIPKSRNAEDEMMQGPWFSVEANDVFPEEFGPFFLSSPVIRERFLNTHQELLTYEFWKDKQERILAGIFDDIFPYPEYLRFCNRYPDCEKNGTA